MPAEGRKWRVFRVRMLGRGGQGVVTAAERHPDRPAPNAALPDATEMDPDPEQA